MNSLRYFGLIYLFLGLSASAFELTPELAATGLRTVVVTTIDGEEPVCESVEAPVGSWGVGITNVNKVPGSVTVLNPDGSVVYESGDYSKKESGMTIKVRGNTSARFAKKPYKIKLEKKGDLMARGDKSLNDKNWVLLTAPHNLYELGFLIGEWLEMPWAPAYEYVNLVVNGDCRGLYTLAEAVERNEKCRIVTDESGFVAERDPYWWNQDGEYLPSGWNPQFNWTMKYPDYEDLTLADKDYITGVLHDFEEIIATDRYEELIDIDSFCKWLIAQDILGTSDGGGTNFYLAKADDTPSSKVYVPVLWDVDSGEETVDAWSAVHYETMISPLFNNFNPRFRRRYVELYRELSPDVWQNVDALTASLTSDAWEGFDKAVALNNSRWGAAPSASLHTASHNAKDMERWFPARKLWLDNAVDELEASLGVGCIPDAEDYDFVRIYNLGGVKVYEGRREEYKISTPGIYIMRYGAGVEKLYIP